MSQGRDDENEKEDDVTEVFAEPATLVFKKDAIPDDESTRELPWPTLRRLPELPVVVPLPPAGFDTISASLAAASLPPLDFTAALARENAARRIPRIAVPRVVPSRRVAGALTAAVVLALVAFVRSPAPGAIVVDASDPTGAPVSHLDVFVDGERVACNAAPCSVPGAKGLHEVRVTANGFDAPATQAVALSSGSATAVHFLVSPPRESGVVAGAPQAVVKLEPIAPDPAKPDPPSASAPAPAPIAAPVLVATTPAPHAARTAPVYSAPAAVVATGAAAAPAAAKASRPAGDGFLNVNSIPASTCFLDGRSLGSTPRLRLEVSAGPHTVKFRAPGSSSTKTVVVSVGAGETRLAVARL